MVIHNQILVAILSLICLKEELVSGYVSFLSPHKNQSAVKETNTRFVTSLLCQTTGMLDSLRIHINIQYCFVCFVSTVEKVEHLTVKRELLKQ